MTKFSKLTSDELEVFDEKQRDVVVRMQDGFESALEDVKRQAVDQAKEELGHDSSIVGMDERQLAYRKDAAKLNKMKDLWKSNGVIPGAEERMSVGDMIGFDQNYSEGLRGSDNFSTDHPLLIPRVISEVVKEAIEPNIVLTGLLQRINYQHGTQLTFPSVGAFSAADIPEGGEYPERSLDFAGQVVATIGKSGLAVKMTEEMIRYSLYDVMSMHLRAAGKALIRHKEEKVADLIIANAGGTNTIFDNTSASYPSTTGRDAGGGYNGTLTLDDLHKAYATFVARGFTPNALIMNPFAWSIFADEALMRAFGFQNGAGMWQALQGAPGAAPQWSNGGFGNGLLQNTTVGDPQQLASTHTMVPGLFPYAFKIIVSPYMPYNASNNTTDMILCSVDELGVLVVDEDVVVDSWNDPARDIMKVKLRERYGLGSMNSGQGSGLIKGVSLDRSFDFAHNIQTTIATTGLGSSLTGDSGFSGVTGQA